MEPWQEPRHGRGWLILLLGITVFAAFGAVVGYAYFKGLPGIGGEPPLIKAQEGPYRRAPSDRGGLEVSNANSRIVNVLRPQDEPPRVERLLPAETAPALELPEPDAYVEPAAVPAPDRPLTVLTTPEDGTGIDVPALDATDPAAATALPYPRSKPLPRDSVVSVEPAERTISALPEIEPAAAPDEPAPALEPQVVAPEPEPTVPEPSAPLRPVIGAGIYRLQLAAVRTEGGLTQAWADLRQRYPAALGTVNPQVERTDTTSGPLYRLQAGPFASREAAANACGSIRGSGGQCFIVGPIGQ